MRLEGASLERQGVAGAAARFCVHPGAVVVAALSGTMGGRVCAMPQRRCDWRERSCLDCPRDSGQRTTRPRNCASRVVLEITGYLCGGWRCSKVSSLDRLAIFNFY